MLDRVDAERLDRFEHRQRSHIFAIGKHDRWDVGDVVLVLTVVATEPVESPHQLLAVEYVGTHIDFVDLALFVGGVFLFDNSRELSVTVAHNTTQTGRIFVQQRPQHTAGLG